MGGSYRSLTELFGGSYLQVDCSPKASALTPSACPIAGRTSISVTFISVLIQDSGKHSLSHPEERDLYEQIEMLYSIDPSLRTLSTLRNTLNGNLKDGLHKWTQERPFGFLFDNSEDTLSFSRFQCIEFEGNGKLSPAHRALALLPAPSGNAILHDPELTGVFKPFVIDEAWIFFRNPRSRTTSSRP